MKKMGTKIRRGIILTSMFVVMSSSMVLAARYEDSYGFGELIVKRSGSQAKAEAMTYIKTSEFTYLFLDVTTYYNDGSEWSTSRTAVGRKASAQYVGGYEDADGFESMHRCENSLHQVGFNCRLSG